MTYILVAILILLSGLFSGLNLGLMGLNTQELKRKAHLGNKDAKKIYPIRKTGNFLLVTLLLGNVAVNAAIAILLGSVASGLVAGIVSTVLITLFGEIIPQATFSRFALKFGAKFVWLVKIFMYGLYPLTKPVAWALDKALGAELGTVYSKRELIEIIEEHKKSRSSDIGEEEERIVRGALTFADKTVRDVMTPETAMLAFEQSHKIDESFLDAAIDSGFSRFPVYRKKLDILVGVVHIHDMFRKKSVGKTVGSVAKRKFLTVAHTMNLAVLFQKFLKSRQQIAIVQNEFGTVIGLVTLEDIIEEILQDEIVDERDRVVDTRKRKKK